MTACRCFTTVSSVKLHKAYASLLQKCHTILCSPSIPVGLRWVSTSILLPLQVPRTAGQTALSASPVGAVPVRVEQKRDVEVLTGHVGCDGKLNHCLRVERHRPEYIWVRLPAQQGKVNHSSAEPMLAAAMLNDERVACSQGKVAADPVFTMR